MFRLRDVMTLGVGEQLRLLVRAKRSTLVARLIACGLCTVFASVVAFSVQAGGTIFFIALLVLGLSCLIAIRQLVMWDGTVLAVTDRRCLLALRRGFVKRSLVELPLSSIQGVEVGKQGLVFRAHGVQREAVFPPIARPNSVISMVSPGGRSS